MGSSRGTVVAIDCARGWGDVAGEKRTSLVGRRMPAWSGLKALLPRIPFVDVSSSKGIGSVVVGRSESMVEAILVD